MGDFSRNDEIFSGKSRRDGLKRDVQNGGVNSERSIGVVRITQNYRALGYKKGDTVYWNWIGDHREYEKEIQKL